MKKKILFGVFFVFGIAMAFEAFPHDEEVSPSEKNYREWCQDTLSYRGCGVGNGPECSTLESC